MPDSGGKLESSIDIPILKKEAILCLLAEDPLGMFCEHEERHAEARRAGLQGPGAFPAHSRLLSLETSYKGSAQHQYPIPLARRRWVGLWPSSAPCQPYTQFQLKISAQGLLCPYWSPISLPGYFLHRRNSTQGSPEMSMNKVSLQSLRKSTLLDNRGQGESGERRLERLSRAGAWKALHAV